MRQEAACGAECPGDTAGSAGVAAQVAVPGCGALAQVAVSGCGAAARTPVLSVVKRGVEPRVKREVQMVNPGTEEEHRKVQRAVVERFTQRTTENESGPMFMSLHYVCDKCWSVSKRWIRRSDERWYCQCCNTAYKAYYGLLIQAPKRWTYAGLLRSRALHDPAMPRGSHVDPL